MAKLSEQLENIEIFSERNCLFLLLNFKFGSNYFSYQQAQISVDVREGKWNAFDFFFNFWTLFTWTNVLMEVCRILKCRIRSWCFPSQTIFSLLKLPSWKLGRSNIFLVSLTLFVCLSLSLSNNAFAAWFNLWLYPA